MSSSRKFSRRSSPPTKINKSINLSASDQHGVDPKLATHLAPNLAIPTVTAAAATAAAAKTARLSSTPQVAPGPTTFSIPPHDAAHHAQLQPPPPGSGLTPFLGLGGSQLFEHTHQPPLAHAQSHPPHAHPHAQPQPSLPPQQQQLLQHQQQQQQLQDQAAHDADLDVAPGGKGPSKTVRRGWTRGDLFKGGVSVTLLNALDNFTNNIPQIPNQVDHGKKTNNRDMRGWINSLQEPAHVILWKALVNTLRSDSTAESYWGHSWDRHLCRYILGKVVSREKVSPNNEGRSHSRQAVNNAIKRELDCHFEPKKGGQRVKSTRSKTFRDLFREKCREAGVPVPAYEDSKELFSSTNSESPSLNHFQQQQLQQPQHMQYEVRDLHYMLKRADILDSTPPLESSRKRDFVSFSLPDGNSEVNAPASNAKPPPAPVMPVSVKVQPLEVNQNNPELLAKLRKTCSSVDEWGQTAWWSLPSDEAIIKLPYLLVETQLYELRSLLLDFRWIKRTFQCIDFSSGMRQISTDGYDLMVRKLNSQPTRFSPMEMEGFRLIRNALMLTLPIIKEDEASVTKGHPFFAHLATQLTGRLLDLKRRFSNIAQLVHSIELHAPRPWLRPLDRYFLQPRTDIKLVVPSNGASTPHQVVLSDDGSVLVTSGTMKMQQGASKKHMIRIWNVDSGKCMLDHEVPNIVNELALDREKTCVTFATSDGLYFWSLRTSQGRTTIGRETISNPVSNDVRSIACTADSNYVLTTHQGKSKRKIVLWDTRNGASKRLFDSLDSIANCIDVSPDGKLFVSGHQNGLIHVWGLEYPQDDEDDSKAEASSNQQQPILSFQSYVKKIGQHPVVDVSRANKIRPEKVGQHSIHSICYHEHDEKKRVTAVLGDNFIRVWELPPILLNSRTTMNKEFMTTICRSCFYAPYTRQVQWSSKDRLYTGGDDGMAYEWECDRDDWICFPFEKEKPEESRPNPPDTNSPLLSALISVGRQSEHVATYLTKSPYVIVWDMSRKRSWDEQYSLPYRSHCALIGKSVDQMDIKMLRILSKPERDGGNTDSYRSKKGNGIPRNLLMHDISIIRQQLEKYFLTLDVKNRVTVPYEMQPRLLMRLSSKNKDTPTTTLEVCFEQSVMWCVSGIFTPDRRSPSGSITKKGGGHGPLGMTSSSDLLSDMIDSTSMSTTVDNNPGGGAAMKMGGVSTTNGISELNARGKKVIQKERRGMVAALVDESVAIFELEEDQFGTLADDTTTSKVEAPVIGVPGMLRQSARVGAQDVTSVNIKKQANIQDGTRKQEVLTSNATGPPASRPLNSRDGQTEIEKEGGGEDPMVVEDNEVEIVKETKIAPRSIDRTKTNGDGDNANGGDSPKNNNNRSNNAKKRSSEGEQGSSGSGGGAVARSVRNNNNEQGSRPTPMVDSPVSRDKAGNSQLDIARNSGGTNGGGSTAKPKSAVAAATTGTGSGVGNGDNNDTNTSNDKSTGNADRGDGSGSVNKGKDGTTAMDVSMDKNDGHADNGEPMSKGRNNGDGDGAAERLNKRPRIS